MLVNDALIEKLSRLSMLDFTEDEKVEIKIDLQKMIGFFDKLKELDTTGTDPLLHMGSNINILREDRPGEMLNRQDALKNSGSHDGKYFKVPKVIKKPE